MVNTNIDINNEIIDKIFSKVCLHSINAIIIVIKYIDIKGMNIVSLIYNDIAIAIGMKNNKYLFLSRSDK